MYTSVCIPADPALGCVGVVLDGDESPVGAAGVPPTGAAGSEPPTFPSLSAGIPCTQISTSKLLKYFIRQIHPYSKNIKALEHF